MVTCSPYGLALKMALKASKAAQERVTAVLAARAAEGIGVATKQLAEMQCPVCEGTLPGHATRSPAVQKKINTAWGIVFLHGARGKLKAGKKGLWKKVLCCFCGGGGGGKGGKDEDRVEEAIRILGVDAVEAARRKAGGIVKREWDVERMEKMGREADYAYEGYRGGVAKTPMKIGVPSVGYSEYKGYRDGSGHGPSRVNVSSGGKKVKNGGKGRRK